MSVRAVGAIDAVLLSHDQTRTISTIRNHTPLSRGAFRLPLIHFKH